jgi:hypothetical protein
MRIIHTLAAHDAAQKKIIHKIERVISTLIESPESAEVSNLRSLKKEIDKLKRLLPAYKLEYDTDARESFLRELRSEYLGLGTGVAFAQAVTLFGEEYFADPSDTPRFDRELKSVLRSIFDESSLPVWDVT